MLPIPLSPGFFTRGVAVGTKRLILANFIVHFILHGLMMKDASVEEYLRVLNPLGLMADNLFDWRLIGYGFVHGDFMHLFGNMLFLLPFAVIIEEKFDARRMWLLYLASLAASGIVWGLLETENVPLVGASGAVAGMMAAAMVLRPHIRVPGLFIFIIIPVFISAPVWLWAALHFVIDNFNFIVDRALGGRSSVAYSAHIGGFVFAFAACWLMIRMGWVKGVRSDLVTSFTGSKKAYKPSPATGPDAIAWHDVGIIDDIRSRLTGSEELPVDRLLGLARLACENGQGIAAYTLLQEWTERHPVHPEAGRVFAEVGFIALKSLHRNDLARSWLAEARRRDITPELAARIDSAMRIL